MGVADLGDTRQHDLQPTMQSDHQHQEADTMERLNVKLQVQIKWESSTEKQVGDTILIWEKVVFMIQKSYPGGSVG